MKLSRRNLLPFADTRQFRARGLHDFPTLASRGVKDQELPHVDSTFF